MTDVTPCPDPDALLVLLYDDEGAPDERALLQAHVNRCPQCADVLTSLDTARALGAWHAPRLPLGFAFVHTERSPWRTTLWRGGLAAAAVLVLGAAVSLARFDITYSEQGLRIRTGVERIPERANAAVSSTDSLKTARTAAPATPTEGTWVSTAAVGEPPWRADFDLLATQIRGDVSRMIQENRHEQGPVALRAAVQATPAAPGRTTSDAELLKQVQDLLDQSEIRQQANLALRVTELGRQFELARQSDIVQVEQTLQRIEQQRGDLLRRVAATQPRP